MSNDRNREAERDREEGFLGRWSRRKRGEELEADVSGKAAIAEPGETIEVSPDADAETTDREADAPQESFDDIDLETLDAESDYTRFMGENVPEDVKNQALSKLWISDPVFANLDGLTDYSEDFTDAATVPIGPLKTAYKVGQGFLSD